MVCDIVSWSQELSPELKRLMEGLLHIDSGHRLTAANVLASPWLAKDTDEEVYLKVMRQRYHYVLKASR